MKIFALILGVAVASIFEERFKQACNKGDFRTITTCVNLGVNPSTPIYDNGTTCLMLAAEDGNLDIVNFLLSKGVSVNQSDSEGYTAMHLCAGPTGNFKSISHLVSHGANLNLQLNDGNMPLHLAAANGHAAIVKFLLSKNASVSIRNNIGNTPIHAVYSCKNQVKAAAIFDMLVEKGSDPLQEVKKGVDGLVLAMNHKSMILLKKTVEFIKPVKGTVNTRILGAIADPLCDDEMRNYLKQVTFSSIVVEEKEASVETPVKTSVKARPLYAGSVVLLTGLQNAEYCNKSGLVVGEMNKGRYPIQLYNGKDFKIISIKAENIETLKESALRRDPKPNNISFYVPIIKRIAEMNKESPGNILTPSEVRFKVRSIGVYVYSTLGFRKLCELVDSFKGAFKGEVNAAFDQIGDFQA